MWNCVLLTGPSGSGKTAAIYALAQELGYNVLEVNASSKRNGKSVLSHLHEATQSHSLSSSNNSSAMSKMFAKVAATAAAPATPATPASTPSDSEDSRSPLSLMLFEDVTFSVHNHFASIMSIHFCIINFVNTKKLET